MHRAWIVLFGLATLASVHGALPVIDGDVSEWSDASILARDKRGDADGAFDLGQVSALSSGTKLYLRFDSGRVLNLQSGPAEDGTLQILIDSPGKPQLEIDFRKRALSLGRTPLRWSELGFVCLPTYASGEFELVIDLARVGIGPGDRVSINFGGSDQLDRPIELVLEEATERPEEPIALSSNGAVRIVNLNTLREGFGDPERSSSIQRLLAASDADIICLQEEWDEQKFRNAVPEVVATPADRSLNVAWSRGRAIVTEWPMERLAIDLDSNLACRVDLPSGESLVVFNLHLKCCGSATGSEETRRIRQANQLVAGIKAIRRGQYGEKAREAGFVLIGDYNLVGSREPVTILESAGMQALAFSVPDGGAAYTWRGINGRESFYPGRLDWLTYDPRKLQATQSVIVDTTRMSQSALRRLGLKRDDSLASDHLLLVADFVVAR